MSERLRLQVQMEHQNVKKQPVAPLEVRLHIWLPAAPSEVRLHIWLSLL